MTQATRGARPVLLLALLAPLTTGSTACGGLGPFQRVPTAAPDRSADELPPPGAPLAGGEARGAGTRATVVRHADPVELRLPGALDAFPMRFWRKARPVAVGTTVITHSGGRAELSWEGEATTVVLSGVGSAVIGDPAADEPLVALREVTHARLVLAPDDRIELPGGAELFGDDERVGGPFVVARIGPETLRLENQSGLTGLLRFRDATLEIGPAEALDVPILRGRAGPFSPPGEVVALVLGGLPLRITGELATAAAERTVRVEAAGEGSVEALGVRIELGPGERATLSSMRPRETGTAVPAGGVRADPPISSLSPARSPARASQP